MSQRITIQIANKIATCMTALPIVCGNSDYLVDFIFDEEWNEHSVKTARFKVNDTYIDKVFEGNVCEIPIITNAKIVWIGVFAGDLSTSTPALVQCRPSILDGEEIPAPPREDVYAQIIELCEDAKRTAESIEERANNGEFKGEDGEDGKDGLSEWDYVITSAEDFTTETLATMRSNVLVKGVNTSIDETLNEFGRRRVAVPETIEVLNFVSSRVFTYLTGTKKTKVVGLKGDNDDFGAYFTTVVGFGAVEFCENIDVENCDNVRHCGLRKAIDCTNLNDISSNVHYGDEWHNSFRRCTVIDNVRISGREDGAVNGVVEFIDCSHISNVFNTTPHVPIDYVNCASVVGDTCDGYYTTEDIGKVESVTADGTKSLVSVYSQDEIDSKLGDLSTILTALHEGGIE